MEIPAPRAVAIAAEAPAKGKAPDTSVHVGPSHAQTVSNMVTITEDNGPSLVDTFNDVFSSSTDDAQSHVSVVNRSRSRSDSYDVSLDTLPTTDAASPSLGDAENGPNRIYTRFALRPIEDFEAVSWLALPVGCTHIWVQVRLIMAWVDHGLVVVSNGVMTFRMFWISWRSGRDDADLVLVTSSCSLFLHSVSLSLPLSFCFARTHSRSETLRACAPSADLPGPHHGSTAHSRLPDFAELC